MTKVNYLGPAKPGSRMFKRGWLINMNTNGPAGKPAEKAPEKAPEKEEKAE